MIVQVATEPAAVDRENEDFFGHTDNVFVLLDGAGTPDGSDSGCTHGVAWFARHLGEAILEAATTAKELPLTTALRQAITTTANAHRGPCDLSHPGTPSATVVVVRYRPSLVEYLVLADSTLVIQTPGGVQAITDDREARVGRMLRGEMDRTPVGSTEHKEAHKSYVEAMRSFRNQPRGFWVASADPSAADEALTGAVPRHELLGLALMSDGATRLVDRFSLLSWSELMKMLAAQGPKGLLQSVRAAEESDPEGRRWPRGKARDDATAAYIQLEGTG